MIFASHWRFGDRVVNVEVTTYNIDSTSSGPSCFKQRNSERGVFWVLLSVCFVAEGRSNSMQVISETGWQPQNEPLDTFLSLYIIDIDFFSKIILKLF